MLLAKVARGAIRFQMSGHIVETFRTKGAQISVNRSYGLSGLTFGARLRHEIRHSNGFKWTIWGEDGMDAALSPTAPQCGWLVMLQSQEKQEGIHKRRVGGSPGSSAPFPKTRGSCVAKALGNPECKNPNNGNHSQSLA